MHHAFNRRNLRAVISLQIKDALGTLLKKIPASIMPASHYLVNSLSNRKSLASVYCFGFE